MNLQRPALLLVLGVMAPLGSSCRSGHAASQPSPDAGSDAPSPDAGEVCVGTQGPVTLGGDCGCQDDCNPSETCFDERSTGRPGGRCGLSCTSTGSCPAGFDCLGLLDSQFSCFEPCTVPADCPTGSLCTVLEDGQHHCLDYCTSDDECLVTGKCDLFTGRCVDPTYVPVGGDPGDPCNADGDCKSALCNTALPSGHCTTLCRKDTCPLGTNTKCVLQEGVVGYGFCLRKCALDSECPPGQECTSAGGCYGLTP